MKHAHSGVRRSVGSLATLALVAGASAVLATPAQAATAPTAAAAAPVAVTGASLTWGLNGYSQVGIFGPWTYKDLSGNVSQLVGSVSGGSQTEYVVAPIPATSMPVSSPQKTPNAVKFTAGTGTSDPATGESTLAWDGSYTVNAYPAQYNAPNEIYSDPELTTAADGSGELTMNFALGEGIDMAGNPAPAQDFGRVTLATFDAGSSAPITGNPDAFRLTPDYQGVEVTIPADGGAQNRSCTTDGGNTGWWGSWPQEFISDVPASVRPHFYSTGCGGNQNYKPALPFDVDLNVVPSVSVSDATLLPSGVQQVTVNGSGFLPGMATGTRPPLSGKAAGAYIAFGRYADVWRPSAGAPSSTRVNQGGAALKWAVSADDMATVGGAAGGAVELRADGTFTATLEIDKDAIDTKAPTGNYGIYTYPGSGGSQAAYETYTPITFAKAVPTVSVAATGSTYGTDVPVTVKLTNDSGATGDVTLKAGDTTVGTATLAGGSASFTLVKPAAGTHDLVATYAGDVNHEAASGTTRLTVTAAPTAPTPTPTPGTADEPVKGKAKVAWGTKPTAGKKGTAVVTVSELATGKVTAVLRNAKGRLLRTVTARIKDDVVKVKLPRLGKGRYALVVKVPGNDDVAKARVARTFRVK
jgi:hypothetical protein